MRMFFNRYINKFGPIVGVSLHMGNWELAIWPMTLGGKKARCRLSLGQ